MPQPPNQTEIDAIDNLSVQVQSLQLQVAELNSSLNFDLDALQLGMYYSIVFFIIGLTFGIVASLLRRGIKH